MTRRSQEKPYDHDMTDAFLLGAGFSKAISPHMPVLPELSTQVRSTMRSLKPPHSALSENIEIWLSYLSQTHPWLTEQDNLRNRALALDVTQNIKGVLDNSERAALQEDCPLWLHKLARHWHYEKSCVITLNYDTLVERSLGERDQDENFLAHAENIYPVPFTLSTRRNAAVLGARRIESFTFFKLHGSVNWYYSGSDSITGETLYYTSVDGWGSELHRESESALRVNDKVPLIVPPTTEKSAFFRHESMRQIWTQAALAIGECDRLFVIGYSLPVTDLAIRLFLIDSGSTGAPKKELLIVNSDPGAVRRYRELLESTFDVRDSYIGPDAVERFVDDVCRDANGDEE